MDAVQFSLFAIGIGLCLTPLRWINAIFTDTSSSGPLSIWTLLVPGIGVFLIGASLDSYHKKEIQEIFQRVFTLIDQSGLGLHIGNLWMNNSRLDPSDIASLTPASGTKA